MKKNYFSPELDVIKITMAPILTPSEYTPNPQVPRREGDDEPESGNI